MACHHSSSSETSRRRRRTSLGYRTFACRACRTVFNERTGTPFNDLQHPTDLVLLTVLWRLRYKLSFRDVAVLLLQRGFEVTHETVREWEFRFACWARIFDRERSGEHWRAVRSCSYVAVPGSVRIARMNIAAPRGRAVLSDAGIIVDMIEQALANVAGADVDPRFREPLDENPVASHLVLIESERVLASERARRLSWERQEVVPFRC